MSWTVKLNRENTNSARRYIAKIDIIRYVDIEPNRYGRCIEASLLQWISVKDNRTDYRMVPDSRKIDLPSLRDHAATVTTRVRHLGCRSRRQSSHTPRYLATRHSCLPSLHRKSSPSHSTTITSLSSELNLFSSSTTPVMFRGWVLDRVHTSHRSGRAAPSRRAASHRSDTAPHDCHVTTFCTF